MSGTMRRFEPHITRSGGVPSKYQFTVRCSECSKSDAYKANQSVSDGAVAGYFKERGWLLGRDRSYDLCPACLARPRDPERRRDNETPRHGSAMVKRQPDREAASMKARHKETADILARHFSKPEALAAEVFRPRETQARRTATPDTAPQPVPAPPLSPELEQVLTGMTVDLKSLRSTMELMAEQMSKLVALGSQQIEAIARLAPLIIQSSDRISGGLKDLVSATQPNAAPSDISRQEHPSPVIESRLEPEVSSEPEPDLAAEPEESAKRTRRSRINGSTNRRAASDYVVVRSIADAKRPDRFYTTIRLPRELWDRSGFGPEDRLQIDWEKKTVSISRVSDGGVKPKSIGNAVVVLQSWRLGDLNFDPAKIGAGDGVLRLTSP